MKIFIFKKIEKCTDQHHTDGGLVIVARDIEAAKNLIKLDSNISISDDEWKYVIKYELDKNYTYMHKFFVMPNSGCC